MFLAQKSIALAKAFGEADLAAINALSLRELTAEDVYTFGVTLCDDQPDRYYERFSVDCLHALAPMFVGKPILFDHCWSAHEQTARIYSTEVVKEGNVNRLTARVYLLRRPDMERTIAAIDGGILKEISVGCAVGKVTCSICGQPYLDCAHRHGRSYDGGICYSVLSEPADAYEASFVAVPAQPAAGVRKSATPEIMSTSDAQRAKMRLHLEKIRFGGTV